MKMVLSRVFTMALCGLAAGLVFSLWGLQIAQAQAQKIVHDAEYYVLEAQNGEKWAKEDSGLDKKLAELRKKHGRPPNLIHIMWDDTAYGDVGIPAIQKVRGLDTPSINQLAAEGILFTRMYTEVGRIGNRTIGGP